MTDQEYREMVKIKCAMRVIELEHELREAKNLLALSLAYTSDVCADCGASTIPLYDNGMRLFCGMCK